jgi:hypothetical protein
MTIETATPTSAETLAALFDAMIDAVAVRVMVQVQAKIEGLGASMDEEKINLVIDQKIADFAYNDFETKVNDWAEGNLQQQFDKNVLVNVGDMDGIHDAVVEVVSDMSFEIRVSR